MNNFNEFSLSEFNLVSQQPCYYTKNPIQIQASLFRRSPKDKQDLTLACLFYLKELLDACRTQGVLRIGK